MKSMKIKTLYQDDEVTLQRLIITVGECQMFKYRQIILVNGEIEVTEVKEPPVWWLRLLKLKKIGI